MKTTRSLNIFLLVCVSTCIANSYYGRSNDKDSVQSPNEMEDGYASSTTIANDIRSTSEIDDMSYAATEAEDVTSTTTKETEEVTSVSENINASPENNDKVKIKFQYSAFLNRERTYFLQWKTNKTHITFEVQAKTLGWVGLGLSPNGGMTDSDIAVMWIVNGNIILQDRYAKGYYEPLIDKHNDLHLLYGYENETHTIVAFTRLLETCDEMDRKINTDLVHLLFAFHSKDPPNGKLMKHEYRGSLKKYLFDPVPDFIAPEHTKKISITAEGFTIPHNTTTTYRCFIRKMSGIHKKYHLVGVAPNFDSSVLGNVHHMALHICDLAYKNPMKIKAFNCFGDPVSLNVMMHCFTTFIATWAAGGKAYVYPKEVGYPIGKNMNNRLLVLEVHYDNQNFSEGIVDDSGFDFYLTDKLRKYDAQILTLGNLDFGWGIMIPPRQKEFTIYGLCDSQCTNNVEIPDEGLTVFSYFLHTHLAGIKMRIKHIRDGKELPTLFSDENYSFNYQVFRMLKKPVKLMKNDTLLLECVYGSEDRNTYTLGGLSTHEEMCAAQFLYYPKTEFTVCGSLNDYKTLVKALKLKNTRIETTSVVDLMTLNMRDKDKDIRSIVRNQLDSPEWNNTKSFNIIKNIYETNDVHVMCRFMALPQFKDASLPKYIPYVPPPSTCPTKNKKEYEEDTLS